MDISELTAYAGEKYHIGEVNRRKDLSGGQLSAKVSVLLHPVSGKWVALLVREWDEERGEEVQLCDLKCGHGALRRDSQPWLTSPFRMKGPDWVGIRFGADTRREEVFRLFDEAVAASRSWGYTITLGSMLPARETDYRDTPLPPRSREDRAGTRSGGTGDDGKHKEPAAQTEPEMPRELRRIFDEARAALRTFALDSQLPTAAEAGYRDTPLQKAPEKLREMMRLYDHSAYSFQGACKNFYVQGKFMEDYEDDAPWNGELRLYFPCYHDLRLEQLRGYFTWRTALRRGEFRPISTSLAYIYVYELLNEIGAADAADSLRKLREFEIGYLDSGIGEADMRRNLRRWMLEKAVLSGLEPEIVREYADPETLRWDAALAALKEPKTRTDEEIFDALVTLGPAKFTSSLLFPLPEARCLFARAWRQAAAEHREEGKSLFTLCFGRRVSHRWYPLSNAVYYERQRPAAGTCELDECRRYTYGGGQWTEQCYQKVHFDKKRLEGLLHEAERQLRAYLKIGRALQERREEAWAAPYVRAVIEEDRRRKAEEARKKIVIDLGGLEKIRQDAMLTRDSLLTEEERAEPEERAAEPAPVPEEAPPLPAGNATLDLEPELMELLQLAAEGKPTKAWLAETRRMPTVAADAINEALFDEIGDTALEWDGMEFTLAEDYREDVLRLLGGDQK